VPGGELEGKLAQRCICGYPMETGAEICLVQMGDGGLHFCHVQCVYIPEGDDDAKF
jgi:hypothetical protein